MPKVCAQRSRCCVVLCSHRSPVKWNHVWRVRLPSRLKGSLPKLAMLPTSNSSARLIVRFVPAPRPRLLLVLLPLRALGGRLSRRPLALPCDSEGIVMPDEMEVLVLLMLLSADLAESERSRLARLRYDSEGYGWADWKVKLSCDGTMTGSC